MMPLLTVTMIRSSNVIHRTELSTDANPFQDVKTELQGIKDKPFSSTWSLLYTMINNGTSSRVVQDGQIHTNTEPGTLLWDCRT